MAEKQQDYAMQPGKTAMDLVLFRSVVCAFLDVHSQATVAPLKWARRQKGQH